MFSQHGCRELLLRYGYRVPQDTIIDTPKASQQPSVAPRLKGKTRKEAKPQAAEAPKLPVKEDPSPIVKRHQVTTHELLKQATIVAAAKKASITLPQTVTRIVEQAIGARKRCAEWFQKTGIRGEGETTARQLHFVETLGKALLVLRPLIDGPRLTAKGSRGVSSNASVIDEQLENRFGVLRVEDTSEDLDIAATDIVVSEGIYELESQSEIDEAFIILLLRRFTSHPRLPERIVGGLQSRELRLNSCLCRYTRHNFT